MDHLVVPAELRIVSGGVNSGSADSASRSSAHCNGRGWQYLPEPVPETGIRRRACERNRRCTSPPGPGWRSSRLRACSNFTKARATRCARRSYDPAQPNPVEHLEVRVFLRCRRADAFGPVGAFGGRQSPGVAAGLHASQSGRCCAAQRAFAHSIPAHIGEQAQRIHAHRANAHAGAAGRAGPKRLGFDGFIVEHPRLRRQRRVLSIGRA